MKHRRNKYRTNIPEPYGEDWLAIGDTLIWLPEDRTQTNDKLSSPARLDVVLNGAGWAIARSALNIMLPFYYQDGIKYQIEWVTKIGEGLSREVYRADVTTINDGEENHDLIAVSLILNDADIDVWSRLIKEQYILKSIYNKTGCFSVPKPTGILWKDGSLFSFTSFIRGFPLEFKTAKSLNKKPWEIVAKIAAEVHGFPVKNLPENLKQYKTREDHAISEINNFNKLNVSEIQDALSWVSENLPGRQNSVLIHGDLLGQNILQTLEDGLFLIDWEYSRLGDPAYDLAIITCGSKKPFQVASGLEQLIEFYLASGGQEIAKKNVHVYEILFVIGWYQRSLDRSSGGHGPEYYLNFLRRLLKRAVGS
ncbi:MAG: phosphotransferase [Desulfobacteraceae bacterium]|jgi:thiamine kinase-like enzyme